MTDTFSVTSSALPSATRVLAFRGTEALSALYSFEIHLLVEDPAFDPASAIGAGATLSIQTGDPPAVFHGVFSTLEIVSDLARGAVVRAVLVPRLWRLTLTRHGRVFVKQSLPTILDAVLQGAGLTKDDYSLKLIGTYSPMEHVCQYRESHFAFLSRRMEREGVYYFFEQGDDRERLIITDDRAFHGRFSAAPVRYLQVAGAGASGIEGLHAFRAIHSAIPGSVRVSDYDYLRPGLDMTGRAPVSGAGEEVHFQGENFTTPEEGARLARVRAEEIKARQIVFRGKGRHCRLRTGYTFALEDHPRAGVDGAYLVTELEHRGGGGHAEVRELLGGDADEGYQVDVVAVPASVQFRPERRTPVPRIYGMEGAVVDGEADTDYAQLDEHGRYLVKMRFDENEAKNGKASARVRMMQPHGGSPESFHFPLRKGTEVLLTFEGGDPDRPVIAGVVPNTLTPSLVTAKSSTKNILQTGGGNRVTIEDEQGKEYIHISSPHKGTYLHLGSPFNPQYNKITNTGGTSLSYTESISTSFTGTDAQTIVEDARVTLIGRSRMKADDPTGQEIRLLMGPTFIDRFEQTALDRLWNDTSQLVGTDAPAAATAMAKVIKLLAAKTIDAGQVAVYVYQLQAAINVIEQDLEVIAADATEIASTPALAPSLNVNLWDPLVVLQNTVQALQTQAGTAVGYAAAGDPTSLTSLTSLINQANLALGVAASSTSTPPVTASGIFPTLTLLLQDAEPPKTAPPAPSPNIQASFINLMHSRSNLDTDIDNAVTLEKHDSTAMDGAPASAPPLHPGSDVKIVGGDYMSMFAQDQRTHVMGTSYGLVLSGQASVVRGGQQSMVFSPTQAKPGATLNRPTTFVGLSFPLNRSDPTTQTIAQRSEVYGDQFSWVDGHVDATILKGKTTHITGGQTAHISGGSTTYVDHKETYAGNTLSVTGHATSIVGVKESVVGAALNVAGAVMALEGVKFALGSMSVSAYTVRMSVSATTISIKGNEIKGADSILACGLYHIIL